MNVKAVHVHCIDHHKQLVDRRFLKRQELIGSERNRQFKLSLPHTSQSFGQMHFFKVDPINCGNCVADISRRLSDSFDNFQVSLPFKVVSVESLDPDVLNLVQQLLDNRTVVELAPAETTFSVKLNCINCVNSCKRISIEEDPPLAFYLEASIDDDLITLYSLEPVRVDQIQPRLPQKTFSLVSPSSEVAANKDVSSAEKPAELQSSSPNTASDNLQSFTFSLGGLTCVSCAGAVTKALKSLSSPASSISFDVSLYPTQKLTASLVPADSFSSSDFVSTVTSTVSKLGFTCTPDIIPSSCKSLKLSISPPLNTVQIDRLRNLDHVSDLQSEDNSYTFYFRTSVGVRDVFSAVQSSLPHCHVSTDINRSTSSSAVKAAWSRFYFAGVMFVIIFSLAMFGNRIPYINNTFKNQVSYYHLIVALLSSLTIVSPAGMIFFKRAIKALIHARAANMDCLIVIAVVTAFVYSTTSLTFGLLHADYDVVQFYETIAALFAFVSLGKGLETLTNSQTSSVITTLLNKQAKHAVLVTVDSNGKTLTSEEIPSSLIEVGDLLSVVPGRSFPADGLIKYGSTEVDESVITGEFRSITKAEGDHITGGSINQSFGRSIVMEVSVTGQDSFLARVSSMVSSAQQSKPRLQLIGDRISAWFVPIVILLAIISFFTWYTLSSIGYIPQEWIDRDKNKLVFSMLFGLAVLVIACPCALGLASPCAIMAGSGVAATHGIIVRSGESLEKSSAVDCVALDKTGTLTRGKEESEFVDCLIAAEKESDHPLAVCIREHFKHRDCTLTATEIVNVPGKGIQCKVDSDDVYVGTQSFLTENGVEIPKDILSQSNEASLLGSSVIFVGRNTSFLGFVSLADTLRPEAKQVVQLLRSMEIEVYILTGDSKEAALHVSKILKIPNENVFANCLPEDKTRIVQQLQSSGDSVLAVGDGLNDAGLLSVADISVAIGAGTDLAIEAADCVLTSENLVNIANLIKICRKTVSKIYQNYVWAFVYNVIFIPVAAGVLYPFIGIRLDPMWGGLLMAISSLSVTLNSLFLKRFTPYVYDFEHDVITVGVVVPRRRRSRRSLNERSSLLDGEVVNV
ncbi:hypothetical protein GEMRC1_002788 [Eukaryota sp. GEM-RC1]